MTKSKNKIETNVNSNDSNGIIKYSDFLLVSLLLLIFFGCSVFLNRNYLVPFKNNTIFQKLSSFKSKIVVNSAENKEHDKSKEISLVLNGHVEGISACLLVKDENNNLPEWLAYHYQILPLRFLVVAVDPNSQTSPMQILHRWKNKMNITVWENDWFLPPGKRGKLDWNDTEKFVFVHRHRQRYFYQKCIQHFHKQNKTWTIFIDADEYLTFNPVGDTDNNSLFQKINNSAYKSNHISTKKYIEIQRKFKNKKIRRKAAKTFNEKLQARTRLPSTINQMTIAQFIKQEKEAFNNSCIVFPRITFGNTEELNKTVLYRDIPKQFNPIKFNTLRFFRWDYRGMDDKALSPGKSFVDVSRLSKDTLTRNMTLCMHSIVKECGVGIGVTIVMLDDAIFKIQHYSMPKELFFAKSDKKRNMDIYNERATFNKSVSYYLKPWLESFVNDVGVDVALDLLEGSGEVGNWKHPDDTSNFVL